MTNIPISAEIIILDTEEEREISNDHIELPADIVASFSPLSSPLSSPTLSPAPLQLEVPVHPSLVLSPPPHSTIRGSQPKERHLQDLQLQLRRSKRTKK